MELHDSNLVWSTDMTYIPMSAGFTYLAAVIDWHSRYVIAWELSNTLDHLFCVSMLEEALQRAHPVIFNTAKAVSLPVLSSPAACWIGRS